MTSSTMYTLSIVFNFNTVDDKNTFTEILRGAGGLVVTKAWPGCVSIDVYNSVSDETQLVLWEKWEKQSDQEAYMEMRKETGLLDLLTPMLSGPLDICVLNEVNCSPFPLDDAVDAGETVESGETDETVDAVDAGETVESGETDETVETVGAGDTINGNVHASAA